MTGTADERPGSDPDRVPPQIRKSAEKKKEDSAVASDIPKFGVNKICQGVGPGRVLSEPGPGFRKSSIFVVACKNADSTVNRGEDFLL